MLHTTDQVRLQNLKLLIEECEERLGRPHGAAAYLARKSGVKAPYISQLLNNVPNPSGKPRTIGDDVARKLETGMDKPMGWLDQDHSAAKNAREAMFLDLLRLLTPAQVERMLGMAEELADLNAAARHIRPLDDPDDPPGIGSRKPRH